MNKKLIIIMGSGTLVVLVVVGGIWFLRTRSVDVDTVMSPSATTTTKKTTTEQPKRIRENVVVQEEPQGIKETPFDPNDPQYLLLYGTPVNDTPPTTTSPVAAPPPTSPDPDGDGLTTIQEEQIGTDPNRADTDGDGYNDGAEVNAGYNPLGTGKR